MWQQKGGNGQQASRWRRNRLSPTLAMGPGGAAERGDVGLADDDAGDAYQEIVLAALLGASKFLPQVVERIEDAFTEEDAAKKKEWHNYGKDGGGAEEDDKNDKEVCDARVVLLDPVSLGLGSAHTTPPAARACSPMVLTEVVAWARAMRARSAPSSVSR